MQRLQVTALTLLREQDFGSYEGKPFYSRPRNPNISGKENYRSQLAEDPNFKDVESKESMTLRMNTFLQERIIPIIHSHVTDDESSVAVVSHGIILSQLWKCLLGFLSKNSVLLSAGLSVGSGGVSSFEHLGCWSNTGYLELDVQKKQSAATREESVVAAAPCTPNPTYSVLDSTPSLHEYAVVIKTVNGREHLKGLKRTKGGVGSSKFYEGQKSIESFFKKREV